jgi:type II secretion system protein N
MRKKRVLYNELNEEIYESKYWTKPKLIFIGLVILILGFLINFSLEEKVNNFLQNNLATNSNCPTQFEKAELGLIPPRISMKKPVILGSCFGQPNNRLNLDSITIKLDFPSIAHLGVRLNLEIKSKDANLIIDPVLSPFSTYIEIEKSSINGNLLHVLMNDDKSPIAGKINLEGFLKFESGTLTDGDLLMSSNNFNFPSQRISGFDLPLIMLYKLNLHALFDGNDKSKMKIKSIEIGKNGTPININLKGFLLVSKNSFANSILNLDGSLKLSPSFMNNFSFVTLMLPQGHTDGNYQMKINGPLMNPGAPQFQ